MDDRKDAQPDGTLPESPERIAELLKSAAHPARIRVLTLLIRGEHEFSKLMQLTNLSKTALANHVDQLIEKGLILRMSRGRYDLTDDGKGLLDAALSVYRSSTLKEQERLERLSRSYTKGFVGVENMTKKVVSKKAEYLPCWLSYTGAVGGSLRALGVDCDVVDVGGYSGYAFLINVARGVTCPSGPTAVPSKTWEQIHRATESMGRKIECFVREGGFPAKEGKPTSEEIEKARELFEKVKVEIGQKDRPVILWGLVVPEYGIVRGYEGDFYIVSTFRRLSNQPENPILFYDLKAPGCLEALFFGDPVRLKPALTDREALERAISFASGEVPCLDNYANGPEALEEWANTLEKASKEGLNYHGNSYVGACVNEGREMCAKFLPRLAQKYPKNSKSLLKAADCYERGWHLMEEFTQIFPFKLQGETRFEARKKGASILRKIKPLEEEAVKYMKQALKEWKML